MALAKTATLADVKVKFAAGVNGCDSTCPLETPHALLPNVRFGAKLL